jgi:hypothetical protein
MSNFVWELSFIVSRILFAAAACSGPMPSPLMREILYLGNWVPHLEVIVSNFSSKEPSVVGLC